MNAYSPVKLRVPNHIWKRWPKSRREAVRAWMTQCQDVIVEAFRDHMYELAVYGSAVLPGGSRIYGPSVARRIHGVSPPQEATSPQILDEALDEIVWGELPTPGGPSG